MGECVVPCPEAAHVDCGVIAAVLAVGFVGYCFLVEFLGCGSEVVE